MLNLIFCSCSRSYIHWHDPLTLYDSYNQSILKLVLTSHVDINKIINWTNKALDYNCVPM
jgi:hypothetical protein